jgi:small GTP-binding protein
MDTMAHNAPSLEAKIVILGAQNTGKTSLVHRYVQNSFIPPNKSQSTVGASFLTTRVHDPESGATIRLQIWDTAGQERFRSISKLYYRGADAAILCYDVSDSHSFEEMGRWLAELREHTTGQGEFPIVLHVVGTKTDIVAADPSLRQVPFEKCIGYVAEQLYPEAVTASGIGRSDGPPAGLGSFGSPPPPTVSISGVDGRHVLASPQSNRSSGFWGSEAIWDCCHEVSSKDGEGIDEVFRVITRKLVDQHARKLEALEDAQLLGGRTPGIDGAGNAPGYFDLPGNGAGSFRLGHGDKRRSWLGFPNTPGGFTSNSWDEGDAEVEGPRGIRKGRCC